MLNPFISFKDMFPTVHNKGSGDEYMCFEQNIWESWLNPISVITLRIPTCNILSYSNGNLLLEVNESVATIERRDLNLYILKLNKAELFDIFFWTFPEYYFLWFNFYLNIHLTFLLNSSEQRETIIKPINIHKSTYLYLELYDLGTWKLDYCFLRNKTTKGERGKSILFNVFQVPISDFTFIERGFIANFVIIDHLKLEINIIKEIFGFLILNSCYYGTIIYNICHLNLEANSVEVSPLMYDHYAVKMQGLLVLDGSLDNNYISNIKHILNISKHNYLTIYPSHSLIPTHYKLQ